MVIQEGTGENITAYSEKNMKRVITQDRYFVLDCPRQLGMKYYVKRALGRCCSAGYQLSGAFGKKAPRQDAKYNVSICGIFKNEAPYLKEWIEFNHIVGVDHFYLYNNNSEDSFRTVLQPYISSGLVTLVEWPHNQQQMQAYKDCIRQFASETKWLGFIDIDEFIVPKSTDSIYDFLKPFEATRGSVCIYWRLYGTSGRLKREEGGLVTEDFTVCWPKYCDIGKCFYNTAFDFDPDSPRNKVLHHFFWASKKGRDLPPVNIFGELCLPGFSVAHCADFPIQINHYFTKSYQEYAAKRAKGDVYFKVNPHDEAYFYEHEMKCTGTDYSAYKYLVKLKLAMEKDNEQ